MCATGIGAFIKFEKNVRMRLCQTDRAGCEWCSSETNYCVSLEASNACAVFVIFCPDFTEAKWITFSQELSLARSQCSSALKRPLSEVEKGSRTRANGIWFSDTLWAEPAADQHTWMHFIWSLLCSYGAKRSCQFPASCHLLVSDTDEKCSVFRSPQHYHSVFSICWDQMTRKCWSSMINVVLCNTWFLLVFFV